METVPIPEEQLAAIAFAGEALAPFFLEDPLTGAAGASYRAFAELDSRDAAGEWPFGDEQAIQGGLSLMVGGLADGITEALAWEYRRLFIGPGHKAVPPWGSVYMDHDGVIFGKTTLELRAWLRTNGIASLAGAGEPDDHLGLLLMLLAWCARNRPDLVVELLQLHILTWSSHYLEALRAQAVEPFFKGLPLVTQATLEGMGDALGIEVSHPRFFR